MRNQISLTVLLFTAVLFAASTSRADLPGMPEGPRPTPTPPSTTPTPTPCIPTPTPPLATPTPTLQPTPTPRKTCRYYSIDYKNLGSNGVADPIFLKGGTIPPCLELILEQAYNKAKSTRGCEDKRVDDCTVDQLKNYAGWTLLDPDTGEQVTPYRCYPVSLRCFLSSSYVPPFNAVVYLDENCASLAVKPPDSEVCNNTTIQWLTSPISLIWEEGYDIESSATVTRFPLAPGLLRQAHLWKASRQAPLLVYDPDHTGNIVSGAQLFGNWTFGGRRLASANLSSIPLNPAWENGYEPLAELDADGDGRISGLELEPLGLWFDANRDGVSQRGEVQTLSEAGVTALYYRPDRIDGGTGAVWAARGYERTINGKTVVGASVDWYGAGASSASQLLGNILSRGGAAVEQPTTDFRVESHEASSGASAAPRLAGLWRWRIEDERMEGGESLVGYLIFKEQPGGVMFGLTVTAIGLVNVEWAHRAVLQFIPLEGSHKTASDGRFSIAFETRPGEGPMVASKAELSEDGQRLEGESTAATVDENGQPVKIIYKWVAERRA